MSWLNWIWQNFTVLGQAWSAVFWLVAGVAFWMFDIGSKIVCAALVVKWWNRCEEALDINPATIDQFMGKPGADGRKPHRKRVQVDIREPDASIGAMVWCRECHPRTSGVHRIPSQTSQGRYPRARREHWGDGLVPRE